MPAVALVIIAAILWGTTGTAQALGPDGVDPLAVGWIRMLIGGFGLLAIARVRRVTRTPLHRGWTALGIATVVSYQLCFFGGVRLAGVALGTAVGIGSAPIWGGMVDWFLIGWRPSLRWLGAAAIAITGAVLVAGQGGDAERPGLGLVLALGAGASYALYSASLQRLAATAEPEHVSSTLFLAGAVVLTPVALLAGIGPLASGRGALMALHLGLVATTLAYVAFTRGVRDTPVSTALLLTLAEPITAVILGVTIVGESLTATASIGIALLLVGVAVAATAPRATPRPAADAG